MRHCDPRDYFTVEVLVVKLFTLLDLHTHTHTHTHTHIHIYISDKHRRKN